MTRPVGTDELGFDAVVIGEPQRAFYDNQFSLTFPVFNRDGIPSPSANDRARNPHRDGSGWAKSAIGAILTNPRYTGHAVWNRQPKEEVLIDVNDVALGHHTKQRWNSPGDWVRSTNLSHPPLIDEATFQAAQPQPARSHPRKPRATPRPYPLRGLLWCGNGPPSTTP
jgi:site-specific DNA recombinase